MAVIAFFKPQSFLNHRDTEVKHGENGEIYFLCGCFSRQVLRALRDVLCASVVIFFKPQRYGGQTRRKRRDLFLMWLFFTPSTPCPP
jgi:hypothetical protein